MSAPVHVYPVNDVVEHVTDGGECPCGPTARLDQTDDGDRWTIVHHSLDGREHHEPDHDRTACPLCSADG